MQFSKLSLITLSLASFSAAVSLEDAIVARDLVIAKAAGEVEKRNIEVRTPKKSKTSSGGGGEEEEAQGDQNIGASVHINMALITGAGAVALAAMML